MHLGADPQRRPQEHDVVLGRRLRDTAGGHGLQPARDAANCAAAVTPSAGGIPQSRDAPGAFPGASWVHSERECSVRLGETPAGAARPD
jgi:hypothetical protein